MNLELAEGLFLALSKDCVRRLANSVLQISREEDLSDYHLLCLGLANWMQAFNVCNEAQSNMLLEEFENPLRWYAESASEILDPENSEEQDPTLPLLLLCNDGRYFQIHNYEGYFDVCTGDNISELPRPTLTYITIDCLALLARMHENLSRLERTPK